MLMDRFRRSRSCRRRALMRCALSVEKWGARALISSPMAAASARHSRAVRSTATLVDAIASALRAMAALRDCVAACSAVSLACRPATSCSSTGAAFSTHVVLDAQLQVRGTPSKAVFSTHMLWGAAAAAAAVCKSLM